jgi:hypothetical protein
MHDPVTEAGALGGGERPVRRAASPSGAAGSSVATLPPATRASMAAASALNTAHFRRDAPALKSATLAMAAPPSWPHPVRPYMVGRRIPNAGDIAS